MSRRHHLPYLVAVNVTRRCNLSCHHCYLDAEQRSQPDQSELTLLELTRLFEDLRREAGEIIVVLTGGEPLLHPQIDEFVEAGVGAGLKMVIGTNGLLLNDARIRRFQQLGLSGFGISIDAPEAGQHDSFRGLSGSFQRSCDAVRRANELGLHAQVHFSVTRGNYHHVAQVVDLSRDLGASIVNFFFLVCVGRGKSVMDLPPDLYESVLEEIARLQEEAKGIMVQTRCTPHFKRILHQRNPDSSFTRASGYDGGGCLAATHYCRIDPVGEVTPCPYMELSGGNIREQPFWDIWDQAQLFESFRQPKLGGRCGACEFRMLCTGCRARSLAQSGNLMAEDPNCAYQPGSGELVQPLDSRANSAKEIEWTPEATGRLEKIPMFVRKMVKKKLEERARGEGGVVTTEMMKRHREERERDLGIRFGR